MAWPQLTDGQEKVQAQTVQAPLKPETFFKPIKELPPLKRLRVAGWGPPETGKSYFGDTFPPPVYVIDTELAARQLAFEHFSDKDIRVFEVKIVDPDTDKERPLECLNEFEQAVKSLKDVKAGTVVVDTISDYWSWMSVYVDSAAEKHYKKSGEPMRTEWSKANERYKYFVMRLSAMENVNVVLLATAKRKYDDQGKEMATKDPSWMYKTPHMVDLEVRFWKNEQMTPVQYNATIQKCRWNRAWNKTVQDLTYDKLMAILRDDLKIKVFQQP